MCLSSHTVTVLCDKMLLTIENVSQTTITKTTRARAASKTITLKEKRNPIWLPYMCCAYVPLLRTTLLTWLKRDKNIGKVLSHDKAKTQHTSRSFECYKSYIGAKSQIHLLISVLYRRAFVCRAI